MDSGRDGNRPRPAMIAGIVVAAVTLIVVIGLSIFLIRRRNKRRNGDYAVLGRYQPDMQTQTPMPSTKNRGYDAAPQEDEEFFEEAVSTIIDPEVGRTASHSSSPPPPSYNETLSKSDEQDTASKRLHSASLSSGSGLRPLALADPAAKAQLYPETRNGEERGIITDSSSERRSFSVDSRNTRDGNAPAKRPRSTSRFKEEDMDIVDVSTK